MKHPSISMYAGIPVIAAKCLRASGNILCVMAVILAMCASSFAAPPVNMQSESTPSQDESVTIFAPEAYDADTGTWAQATPAEDMSISGTFPATSVINTWYSEYVYVNGGTEPYTFNITEGALPAGFFIRQDNSYFYLMGTPSTTGTYKFKLKVTDNRNKYVERELTFKVTDTLTKAYDMLFSSSFTKTGDTGISYSSYVRAEGGTTPYTFNITEGSLPPGLRIIQSGSDFYLEGIPSEAGTYAFTLRVTDRRNSYIDKKSTITISGDVVSVEEADYMSMTGYFFLGTIRLNSEVSSSYISVNGYQDSVKSISIVDGSLPPGLSLKHPYYWSESYSLSGIPNTAGTYDFTLRAVDSTDHYVDRDFSLTVEDTPYETDDMYITDNTYGVLRRNYKITDTRSAYVNGSIQGNITWSHTGGTLPPGISLSPSGSYIYLTGIPNTAGTYTFTLRATDTRNAYVERPFTLVINDAPYEGEDMSITGTFPGVVELNEEISQTAQIYANNVQDGVTWTVADGTLPPGVYIHRPYYYDSRYLYLYGRPNTAGTYTFTLRARDGKNAYVDRPFTITVSGTPTKSYDIAIGGSDFPSGTLGESYYAYVSTRGQYGNVKWKHLDGTLPPGLYLSPSSNTMYLQGTPRQAGTYTFTLRAIDNRNAYTDRPFTVTIAAGESNDETLDDNLVKNVDMYVEGVFPSASTIQSWYSYNVYIYNGSRPYAYELIDGALPPGFVINHNDYGTLWLQGMPDTVGTYTFKLRFIDANDYYTDQEFTVNITDNRYAAYDMAITGTLPDGYTNKQWYSNYVQCEGGTEPYTFQIMEGALPPGFFIRQNGSYFYVEGEPNNTGTYTFTLRVIDQRNAYKDRQLTFSLKQDEDESSGGTPSGTEINDSNFPDSVFREYVRGFDTNNDGRLSDEEIEAVTAIYVPSQGITSLAGIEYFTALTTLNCNYNSITALDLSSNTAVTHLYCVGNALTSLVLGDNTVLKHIACKDNKLSALDVSKNTALEYLNCANNSLTALDVSKNASLKTLDCQKNALVSLTLPAGNGLFYLTCGSNALTTLDVSMCANLQTMNCSGNKLTELILGSKPNLMSLDCTDNDLTQIDISGCTKLDADSFTYDSGVTIIDGTSTVRPRYKTINLILSGQIGMNFFLELPEIQGVDYYDGENCYMVFDINGDNTSNPPQLVDDEFMSNGRHGFRCYVNSVQMADSIDATFHYGNNKTASYTYTIEKYLNSKLNGSGLMRDLAAAIKDYGHYAQIYLSQANGWKLGVDHIAMDAVNTYTNDDIENVKQIAQQYKIVKDKYAGTCVKGASYNLSLASETTINLTLTIADECSGSNVFASLNGGTENMAVRQSNGKYTVEISGISAHLLAEPQTVTVTADGAEDFTIQVAALTFTYNTLNSTSAAQAKKNLAVALYKYYEATNNYRNQ